MARTGPALPRTDKTVKQFLIDLDDAGHAVRKLSFVADKRICRMLWPEKVEYCNDAQMSGWAVFGFKPFSNLSDALLLARHAVREVRVTMEVQGEVTRVTLFAKGLQAGVCAEDARPEYAMCKAVLNAWLAYEGALYGYVLAMGLTKDGHGAPAILPDDIEAHDRFGDVARGGLGKPGTDAGAR